MKPRLWRRRRGFRAEQRGTDQPAERREDDADEQREEPTDDEPDEAETRVLAQRLEELANVVGQVAGVDQALDQPRLERGHHQRDRHGEHLPHDRADDAGPSPTRAPSTP